MAGRSVLPGLLVCLLAACGREPRPHPAVAEPEAAPALPDRPAISMDDREDAERVAGFTGTATTTCGSQSPSEDGHERLGPPGPSDWRHVHPEDTGMSFDAYVESRPVRAGTLRTTLAFQPVGPFGVPQQAVLDASIEFAGLWFAMPARVLPPLPLTQEEGQFRERSSGTQYRTGWFLYDLLPDRRPGDAVVLLGVTMGDLYPEPSWNFVFGEADLRRRVGVWSLARYFPEFERRTRTPATDRLALLRSMKLVVHETGHTFGLEHCAVWQCTMNGGNSMREMDGCPLRLCPDCMRKLAWNRGFDVAERYRKLAEFLERHGLADEAKWHRARVAAPR